jgi:hypothetical protein
LNIGGCRHPRRGGGEPGPLLSDDPRLLFTRYSERYFPVADDLVRYLGTLLGLPAAEALDAYPVTGGCR